jgi:hypothetical protein
MRREAAQRLAQAEAKADALATENASLALELNARPTLKQLRFPVYPNSLHCAPCSLSKPLADVPENVVALGRAAQGHVQVLEHRLAQLQPDDASEGAPSGPRSKPAGVQAAVHSLLVHNFFQLALVQYSNPDLCLSMRAAMGLGTRERIRMDRAAHKLGLSCSERPPECAKSFPPERALLIFCRACLLRCSYAESLAAVLLKRRNAAAGRRCRAWCRGCAPAWARATQPPCRAAWRRCSSSALRCRAWSALCRMCARHAPPQVSSAILFRALCMHLPA